VAVLPPSLCHMYGLFACFAMKDVRHFWVLRHICQFCFKLKREFLFLIGLCSFLAHSIFLLHLFPLLSLFLFLFLSLPVVNPQPQFFSIFNSLFSLLFCDIWPGKMLTLDEFHCLPSCLYPGF
jgi:hypothetical protein